MPAGRQSTLFLPKLRQKKTGRRFRLMGSHVVDHIFDSVFERRRYFSQRQVQTEQGRKKTGATKRQRPVLRKAQASLQ
jgi:hypothetical protein